MIEAIRKVMEPLQRRVFGMIARGVVKSIDDSGKLQKLQLQILADEVVDRVNRIQEYGFASRPKAGAQAVVLFLGGNRDHGVVVGVEDGEIRPKDLAEGEASVYSFGKYQVRVKNDRIQVGKDGTWETVVVGETLAELLGYMIDDLAQHTHPAPGAPPATAAAITARKGAYVTNGKILAKTGGRF